MSSRRDFLKQSSVLSAALFTAPEDIFKSKTPVGVQLYTLRGDIAKDAKGTIGKLSGLGYKEVETFGYREGKFFNMTPAEF